jgi:hypothetical protein
MSAPNYYAFTKRSLRSTLQQQKKTIQLAEKWFEERKQVTNITEPPPGFLKSSIKCKKCNKLVINPVNKCCKPSYCSYCFTDNVSLYNKCISCKAIINDSINYMYESPDIIIPSYDEFVYKESKKTLSFIPLNSSYLMFMDL